MHVVFVCENTELYMDQFPLKTNNDAALLPHIDLRLITTRSGKAQSDGAWFL